MPLLRDGNVILQGLDPEGSLITEGYSVDLAVAVDADIILQGLSQDGFLVIQGYSVDPNALAEGNVILQGLGLPDSLITQGYAIGADNILSGEATCPPPTGVATRFSAALTGATASSPSGALVSTATFNGATAQADANSNLANPITERPFLADTADATAKAERAKLGKILATGSIELELVRTITAKTSMQETILAELSLVNTITATPSLRRE